MLHNVCVRCILVYLLLLFQQLEEARKGSKEGSRETSEKVAAAQAKIEVSHTHNMHHVTCLQ